MKTRNRTSEKYIVIVHCFVALLGLVVAGGCAQGGGLITRPQPSGGDVVNPWPTSGEKAFNELEVTLLSQIAKAEGLDPQSEAVKMLKSEYEKVKRIWDVQKKGNVNALADTSDLPERFVNSLGITMK